MLPNYQHRVTHHGYAVYLRSPGFEYTPMGLQKIASFIVQDEAGHLSVFAFAYSVLTSLPGPAVIEDALLAQAVEVIQRAVDAHSVAERQDYPQEYRDGAFVAVQRPRWWLPSFGEQA